MNTKFVLPLIFGVLILLSTFGAGAQTAQDGYTGPSFDSVNYPDFAPNVPYDCADESDQSTVDATLHLGAGTADNQIKFNTTTLVAPKDSCVALVLRNLSPAITHDLVIEEVTNDPNGANIAHVDMDVNSSTANVGWGPGLNVFFFKTPNVDAQFTYFCEQTGHEDAGMKGTLYVGTGPSSTSQATPGFDALTVLLSIIASVGMVTFYKKRH